MILVLVFWIIVLVKVLILMMYIFGCFSVDVCGRVGLSDFRFVDSLWVRFFVNVVIMIWVFGFFCVRDIVW